MWSNTRELKKPTHRLSNIQRICRISLLFLGALRSPAATESSLEQRIAQLESLFILESQVCGKLSEAVLIVRGDRRSGSRRHRLVSFCLGEIRDRHSDRLDAAKVGLGEIVALVLERGGIV